MDQSTVLALSLACIAVSTSHRCCKLASLSQAHCHHLVNDTKWGVGGGEEGGGGAAAATAAWSLQQSATANGTGEIPVVNSIQCVCMYEGKCGGRGGHCKVMMYKVKGGNLLQRRKKEQDSNSTKQVVIFFSLLEIHTYVHTQPQFGSVFWQWHRCC